MTFTSSNRPRSPDISLPPCGISISKVPIDRVYLAKASCRPRDNYREKLSTSTDAAGWFLRPRAWFIPIRKEIDFLILDFPNSLMCLETAQTLKFASKRREILIKYGCILVIVHFRFSFSLDKRFINLFLTINISAKDSIQMESCKCGYISLDQLRLRLSN